MRERGLLQLGSNVVDVIKFTQDCDRRRDRQARRRDGQRSSELRPVRVRSAKAPHLSLYRVGEYFH